jgi:hypothetical protein
VNESIVLILFFLISMIRKACVEWPSVIDSLVYLCRVLSVLFRKSPPPPPRKDRKDDLQESGYAIHASLLNIFVSRIFPGNLTCGVHWIGPKIKDSEGSYTYVWNEYAGTHRTGIGSLPKMNVCVVSGLGLPGMMHVCDFPGDYPATHCLEK